jgi:hypothetical protein
MRATIFEPFTRGYEKAHLRHAWFAWHPVRINRDLVWWEWVFRSEGDNSWRYSTYDGRYHYRGEENADV